MARTPDKQVNLDIEKRTLRELKEILCGQEQLLRNKKCIQNLPDKGQKINRKIQHLKELIAVKEADEESRLNDVTQHLSQRLIINEYGDSSMHMDQDPTETVAMDYLKRTTLHLMEKPEQTHTTWGKPSSLLKQSEDKESPVPESASPPKQDRPAIPRYPEALLPNSKDYKFKCTQKISIDESFLLQKQQYDRIKGLQFERMMAKLSGDVTPGLDSRLEAAHMYYEGDTFKRYRDAKEDSDDEDFDRVD